MWISALEKYIVLNIEMWARHSYLIQRRKFGRNRCFETKTRLETARSIFLRYQQPKRQVPGPASSRLRTLTFHILDSFPISNHLLTDSQEEVASSQGSDAGKSGGSWLRISREALKD